MDANGVVQTGTIGNLTISSGSIPAKATSTLDFTANLNANEKLPENPDFDPTDEKSYNHTYATQVYDSLGREHTMKQYFVKTTDNEWEVHYYMDDQDLGTTEKMTFTEQGVLQTPTGPVTINASIPGADGIELTLSYSGTTQFGSDFSVSKNSGNGYASGERTGQMIDKDGSVYATFSNGERLLPTGAGELLQSERSLFAGRHHLVANRQLRHAADGRTGHRAAGVDQLQHSGRLQRRSHRRTGRADDGAA